MDGLELFEMDMFNTTEVFMSTTQYVSTTGYVSTQFTSTGDEMESYPDISKNAATEALLAIISISIAVILITCYIRDLHISGVCKKGYRHYDVGDATLEDALATTIQSASQMGDSKTSSSKHQLKST